MATTFSFDGLNGSLVFGSFLVIGDLCSEKSDFMKIFLPVEFNPGPYLENERPFVIAISMLRSGEFFIYYSFMY